MRVGDRLLIGNSVYVVTRLEPDLDCVQLKCVDTPYYHIMSLIAIKREISCKRIQKMGKLGRLLFYVEGNK